MRASSFASTDSSKGLSAVVSMFRKLVKRKRESESGWNDIERLDDDVAGQEDAGLPIWKVNTLVAAGFGQGGYVGIQKTKLRTMQ